MAASNGPSDSSAIFVQKYSLSPMTLPSLMVKTML